MWEFCLWSLEVYRCIFGRRDSCDGAFGVVIGFGVLTFVGGRVRFGGWWGLIGLGGLYILARLEFVVFCSCVGGAALARESLMHVCILSVSMREREYMCYPVWFDT